MSECRTIDVSKSLRLWVCDIGCKKHNQLTLAQGIAALVKQRESSTITQADMASRMGIKQPAVAKLERKDPMKWKLRQLVTYCMALNGELDCGKE